MSQATLSNRRLCSLACAVDCLPWLALTIAIAISMPPTNAWGQAAETPADDPSTLPAQPPKREPVVSPDLFKMTPLAEISLDPRAIDHPAPELAPTKWLSGKLGDLRELRMEQGWTPTTMYWTASNFAHNPLYFEDALLERHGQDHGVLQPIHSAAHFFGTIPLWPAMMAIEKPWECVYSLGYGRPGNCKPVLKRKW